MLADNFIDYVSSQKRYSPRTADIYTGVLKSFATFVSADGAPCSDAILVKSLHRNVIRAYQIHLMDDRKMSPRTVNLHISVLSAFCKFLVHRGVLDSNPVSLVTRPKQPRRLPVFFRKEALGRYLSSDNALSRRDFDLEMATGEERRDTYRLCLNRMIVNLLYSAGIRRAELVGLKVRDLDLGRGKLHVRGKGDKMREIPLPSCVIGELSLYLEALTRLVHCDTPRGCDSPLLVTYSGEALYPQAVDRAVKAELGRMGNDFAGRKSPHVLRHSFATALMEEGADLNSIKEVLGHANLAATQVYTHSSVRTLKKIYEQAHPRAVASGEKATKDK